MNIDDFKAELIVPPIKIERMFFAVSNFIFYHITSPDEKKKLANIQVSFEAKITHIDEENKSIQIQVLIQSVPEQDKTLEFAVMCIGIYTWLDDKFDENAIKNMYQWGASVQTSSIREHIITQTSRGPYNIPSAIPIGLIQIRTETSTEK